VEHELHFQFKQYFESDTFKFLGIVLLSGFVWFFAALSISELLFDDPFFNFMKSFALCVAGLLWGLFIGVLLIVSTLSFARYALLYLLVATVAVYCGLQSLTVYEAGIVTFSFAGCGIVSLFLMGTVASEGRK